MKIYSLARSWRVMLLYAALLTVALPLNACATTPGAMAKNIQPLGDTTVAFIAQGEMWVTQHGARAKQLTHLTAAVTWSRLFWSADTTQIAATFTDTQAANGQVNLVIANMLTGTATTTPQAIYSHLHLAGWMTGGILLLVGDGATPGLSAYDTQTGASTSITTAPIATFTLAAGAVWFVGQQQHPGTGALLARWDVGTQATTTVAFLPGFAIAADGAACGRIQLTADASRILYDSLFSATATPCPNPNGAHMMAIDSGMAWPVFDTLHPFDDGVLRTFTLDPVGQWAAAMDLSPSGTIAAHVVPTNNTAPPATLPTVTLAGADAGMLTIVQNMLVMIAPDSQTQDMTVVVLLPTDGAATTVTTIVGADVAFAPPASYSVTTGTVAITCPATIAPDDITTARIAVIGDSLAQGYGTTNPVQCSFAAQLGTLPSPLTFNRLPTVMIRGMGGYRADQMLTTVPDLVAFTPDIVVVELGTNDERESWPLDQTQAAVDTILRTLQQAPGKDVSHPVIACLSLWPSPGFDAPAQLVSYNALIAQECTRFGGVYVDITLLATPGMSDSTIAPDFNWHPNDRGALNLARLIMSALNTSGIQIPMPGRG